MRHQRGQFHTLRCIFPVAGAGRLRLMVCERLRVFHLRKLLRLAPKTLLSACRPIECTWAGRPARRKGLLFEPRRGVSLLMWCCCCVRRLSDKLLLLQRLCVYRSATLSASYSCSSYAPLIQQQLLFAALGVEPFSRPAFLKPLTKEPHLQFLGRFTHRAHRAIGVCALCFWE